MTVHHHTNCKSSARKRRMERFWLIISSIVFIALFFKLHAGYQRDFAKAEAGYRDTSMVNLSAGATDPDKLAYLLASGGYCEETDAHLVAHQLVKILDKEGTPENLGAFNKNKFRLNDSFFTNITNPHSELKQRLGQSYHLLGVDSTIDQLYHTGRFRNFHKTAGSGSRSISVRVVIKDMPSGIIGTITGPIKKALKLGDKPVSGVLIKLQQYQAARDSFSIITTAYATTDEQGQATFSGLEQHGSYSVLPVQRGYEYGPPQGTTASGGLTSDLEISFPEQPHRIRLLSASLYKQIKEDNILTVRTPGMFYKDFFTWCLAFLLAYWTLHIYWSIKGVLYDQLILPALMALTGLCILMLYAINDPLRDTIRGGDMARFVIAGLICLSLVAKINIVRWYNSRSFDLSRHIKRLKNKRFNQPGYLYALLALGLVSSLLLFGSGPEGSQAKVNLFFFQPSEITKYLVVIFFAAFFTRNLPYFADLDSTAGLPGAPRHLFKNAGKRFLKSVWILSGFALLLGLYLWLGDMGPALVLCGLFIVFYAVARGDFAQLCIGAGAYVLCLWGVRLFAGGSTAMVILVTALWCISWLLFGWLHKKTFYPSAFYLTLVIMAFVYGQDLPKVGQRLAGRNKMFTNIWDNQIEGGDQVAQGIWAVASGGFSGQGLGEGNPNVIPANHTDMILASIGEELGLAGLLVVFGCMAVLLYRGLRTARKAGSPFAFYLAAGISVVTAIQFLVIAAGAFGLMPLTGISVPFLSYGKVSIVFNMAAFGLVLAASGLRGQEEQDRFIQQRFDRILSTGMLSYTVAAAGILLVLANYMILRPGAYLIKPAIVVNANGAAMISKNPRIDLLMKKLQVGDIYDRNQVLLATSSRDKMLGLRSSFISAGIPDSVVQAQSRRRFKRYYPFGNYMHFWLGDYNTRLNWGENEYGYFAENRHFSLLRGLNESRDSVYRPMNNQFRLNRFLAATDSTFLLPYACNSYVQLVPLLRAGLNSSKVAAFDKQKKNLSLTVDARLQTLLETRLQEYNNNGQKTADAQTRTSVVVMNPANGEVLSSAVYPLPDKQAIRQLSYLSQAEKNKMINRISFPGGPVFTERDLGITYATQPGSTIKMADVMAALNQYGPSIVQKEYRVETPCGDGGIKDVSGLYGQVVRMPEAFARSSNIYFIKLLNDQRLDTSLSNVFINVGIGIDTGGYKRALNYYLYVNNNRREDNARQVKSYWQQLFNTGRRVPFAPENCNQYKTTFSKMAYGVKDVMASPMAMARLAGAIMNNGQLKASRFILHSDREVPAADPDVRMTTPEHAAIIRGFMYEQSGTAKLRSRLGNKTYRNTLYGKTGTPSRDIQEHGGGEPSNDGWYVFSVSTPDHVPMVIGIRVERIGKNRDSGTAVAVAESVVLPVLEKCNYIQSK